MKIKVGEFTRENTFLSHMVLDSINETAIKTVTDVEREEGVGIENVEAEISLMFNGVELDIRKFTAHLEEVWDAEVKKAAKPEALKIFEKMKHDFKSKNSTNAKLSRIKEQMDKANNQLKAISENITRIER